VIPLRNTRNFSQWVVDLARRTQEAIWQELISIGQARDRASQITLPNGARESHSWLKQFECDRSEKHYTHSSLRGSADFCTDSGRLNLPDDPEVREQFHRHTVDLFSRGRPLCWVEMCTSHYPFIEDIDVMGSNNSASPSPEDILMHSKLCVYVSVRVCVCVCLQCEKKRCFPTLRHFEAKLHLP
jgi:hypothetical protein